MTTLAAFGDNTRVNRAAALLIGILMAVYWARVLRLAWKEKRRTGRAGGNPVVIPRSWHSVVHMEVLFASGAPPSVPTLAGRGIAEYGPDALSY